MRTLERGCPKLDRINQKRPAATSNAIAADDPASFTKITVISEKAYNFLIFSMITTSNAFS